MFAYKIVLFFYALLILILGCLTAKLEKNVETVMKDVSNWFYDPCDAFSIIYIYLYTVTGHALFHHLAG